MVTVTMLSRNGETIGFLCRGHANHGTAGNDVVCSAISALTQTCILGLGETLGLEAERQFGAVVDEENGVSCILTGDTVGDQLEKAALLFNVMEAGLRSIQASYRNTLKISHREV